MLRDDAWLGRGRVPIDNPQHASDQVDGEDVIGICEEAYTSDHNSANVIPAKGSLVDFGKGKTTA